MISVILGILKMIALIVLVILGLVLLLILLVLLAPVRFNVRGSLKEKKPEGRAKVSWLFPVLSVQAIYDGAFQLIIRILGIPIGANKDRPGKKARKKKTKPPKGSRQVRGNQAEPESAGAEEIESEPEKSESLESKREPSPQVSVEEEPSDQPKAKEKRLGNLFPFARICDKLKSIVQNIRNKWKRIWEKLISLKEKKDQIQAFLGDEANKATIKLAKRQLFRLVRHILPRKLSGKLRFGFDDPYTTGQVLTYISPFYGLYADKLELIPVFEESVLEGQLQIKGRIRIGTVLMIVGRMLLDKNFRKLLRMWMKA